MDSIEISLWLDKRWLEALDRQFPEGGLQKALESYVEVLICQLPKEVQKQIRGEIREEERQVQERHEASRRFAVFHVTQGGESEYFLSEGRTEFLRAAYKLRLYLKDGGQRFADSIPNRCAISEGRFGQYVSERMENTGRVTGAFDVDLDEGKFSALHIMDGWKTFRVKDVATAAYHAMRKEQLSEQKRLDIFLDRLDGKELTAGNSEPLEVQGARRLQPDDITFGGSIEEMDGILNFYLECWFPADQIFGTHVETDANDNYLNVYANYDIATREVRDKLEITLCRGDGADVQFVYKLDENERAALLDKMRGYCQQQTGQSLEEFAALLQMDTQGDILADCQGYDHARYPSQREVSRQKWEMER